MVRHLKEELVLELAGMMREMGRRRPRRLKARDQQMTRFTPVHRCLCLNEVLRGSFGLTKYVEAEF